MIDLARGVAGGRERGGGGGACGPHFAEGAGLGLNNLYRTSPLPLKALRGVGARCPPACPLKGPGGACVGACMGLA